MTPPLCIAITLAFLTPQLHADQSARLKVLPRVTRKITHGSPRELLQNHSAEYLYGLAQGDAVAGSGRTPAQEGQ